MKNRSTVIISLLGANRKYNSPEVHRTTLVKQAFLLENLRPLYSVWRSTFRFIRYFYGPFAEEVFHELEMLIFNGLVETRYFKKQESRILEAKYAITDFGISKLEEFALPALSSLADDLIWALQSLGLNDVSGLTRLTYREPGFLQLLAQEQRDGSGPGDRIPLPVITEANNQTLLTLSMIEGLLSIKKRNTEIVIPSREVVRIYLELLAREVGNS